MEKDGIKEKKNQKEGGTSTQGGAEGEKKGPPLGEEGRAPCGGGTVRGKGGITFHPSEASPPKKS